MHFWLKFFHIVAMTVWFAGLFFLPRLFVAHRRGEPDADPDYFLPVAKTLFFRVMSPAAVLTIALGLVLIAWAQPGAWLVMKLAVVAMAVLLHLYLGVVLYDMGRDRDRHGPMFHRVLGMVPLVLLLALAALTGGKPATAPPLPAPPGIEAAQAPGGLRSAVVPTGSWPP